MITNQELNAVKLSPTKKDFYQIWNELLDTAGKISERWDPTSTNESDPGIVLLKVLTAVADKLNYNIDANILEAFMPSAAQEESMRKLTEMLGYNMKYYQSATTEVKISYNKNIESPIAGTVIIDKFTNIKDIDDTINYVTLAPVNLTSEISFGNVNCMEGELVECETADNNIVSMFHLDDNKRYFLPETQIAENSIFITNIENNIEGTEWKKVDNLNAQSLGAKIFKFGFDSHEGLPYIQFPEDISTIIEDGLRIKYIRTNGGNGNISANTLAKLSTPLSWTQLSTEQKQAAYYDVENFTVTNIRAATNGTNKEGINSAYNNFKKTIGTFDTLVTCRDYMNKIYQLVSTLDNTTPLVSNVIVSDIRSDINRAITLGTFTNRGIEYKMMSKPSKDFTHFDLLVYPFKSVYGLNSKQEFSKSFKYDNYNIFEILAALEDSKTMAHNMISPDDNEIACIKNYYKVRAKLNTIRKVGIVEQADILGIVYKKLYETFNMRQLDFGEEIPYDTLLKVIETADPRIKSVSLDEPTLTTKFMLVDNREVAVTDTEDTLGKECYNTLVLNNVLAGRIPLFNYNTDFAVDFTEKAYSKAAKLDDDDVEYNAIYPIDDTKGAAIHKLRTECRIPTAAANGENKLTLTANEVVQFRAPNLTTTATYPAYVNYYFQRNKQGAYVLESIPATFQSLRDFLKGGPNATSAIAEEAIEYYVNGIKIQYKDLTEEDESKQDKYKWLSTNFRQSSFLAEISVNAEVRKDENAFKKAFNEVEEAHCAVFARFEADSETKKISGAPTYIYKYMISAQEAYNTANTPGNENLVFYRLNCDQTNVAAWKTWIVNLTQAYLDHTDTSYASATNRVVNNVAIKGLYHVDNISMSNAVGFLKDQNGTKYKLTETVKATTTNLFDYYYVPRIWSSLVTNPTKNQVDDNLWHTQDGLGQEAQPETLVAGTEYALGQGEYLLINWLTSATNADGTSSDQKIEKCEIYREGDIIKPNFDLVDSVDWAEAQHSYTKTTIPESFRAIIPHMKGMFTLGSNEQIEIRKLIQVKLDGANTNLYWTVDNLVSTSMIGGRGRLDFPWDEEPVFINKDTRNLWVASDGESKKEKIYLAYTLKEGEYIYYTDMNKSDIAFYGFGTTVRRGLKTPDIFKYTSDDVINSDEISTQGLNAAIPWRNYNLSAEEAELTLTENQFINLTENDTLLRITMGEDTITNDFKSVSIEGTSWKFANEEAIQTLPNLNLKDARYNWQVRSRLNLAVGPKTCQTLKTKAVTVLPATKGTPETIDLVVDSITLINTAYKDGAGTDSELLTLRAKHPNAPLSIKTNKLIQSTATVTEVAEKELNADGVLTNIIADLQIKLFELESLTDNQNQLLNLGNFDNGNFTTINAEERLSSVSSHEDFLSTNPLSFKLNALIPDNNFGLLMIFCQNLSDNPEEADILPTLTATSTDNEGNLISANVLTFFNSSEEEANNSLSVAQSSLNLKFGINVIKVSASAALTLTSPQYSTEIEVESDDPESIGETTIETISKANNKVVFTFGNLDIIPIDSIDRPTLNPKLQYQQIKNDTDSYHQILADIRAIDGDSREFYYNIPITPSIEIDLNPYDSNDTLANPLSWFNYNNINNGFVISEIDVEHLADDIIIAKSSRSNF